ncbi:protein phosphatase 1 regulatory subunit pprA, partial [Quillaja saponaria]
NNRNNAKLFKVANFKPENLFLHETDDGRKSSLIVNSRDPTKQDDPSDTTLDLTSYQLHDIESVELPPNLTELDLTANRLSSLDPRIGHLSNLKKLSLRQNLVEDTAVDPISHWEALSGLEELVLRDNKLMKVPDVSIFRRLLVFDISFNEINSLNGMSKVSDTLKELYVSKNEMTKME